MDRWWRELQVGTVFDEFVGLKIGKATPRLLERIHLVNCEMGGLAIPHPSRELSLIGDEGVVPDHRRCGRLVLFEEDLRAGRRPRRIGDRHHARPDHLGDPIAANDISDFELLGHKPLG